MLKSQALLKTPNQLAQIQKMFLQQMPRADQKTIPLELPFYNFVCYTIDLFNQFIKYPYDATFNIFVVDYHLRKYANTIELYRRFIGFVNSWKKYLESDEAKLFLTFLNNGRNEKRHVKLFLKLRKVLLKSINHKILQEINLTHQDAVTIVHTMNIISGDQKRILTKKINEYFITKNIKYVNNVKFNSAIICEYFMTQINDKTQSIDKFNSNLTNKINHILKQESQQIIEFQEQSVSLQNSTLFKQESFELPKKSMPNPPDNKENKQESEVIIAHEKSLVNLDQCLRELSILKERDLQIDNRFKKLNLSRQDQK